jgi:hypothetical protein
MKQMSMTQPMLLIMGWTASGKGKLAFELAQRLHGQILSIDSTKVYLRMDIRIKMEYGIEGKRKEGVFFPRPL